VAIRHRQLERNAILVGGWPTPLKNMSSSVGMMIFPNIWKVIKAMFQTTRRKIFNNCRSCGYTSQISA
jgi:hypothetical protein